MDVSSALLDWYSANKRLLPWRETGDPYKIWVSEVMLQQTTVQAVVPYYEQFVRRFPTVEELAAGSVDEILALWSGLGYYRRARLMHRAAQEISGTGGQFPSSYRDLMDLPGVGKYTAAAVASMAYNEVVPVLDGNVERVLSRRLGMSEDPKKSSSRQVLFAAALVLLDPMRPGESNQALMEIGATICRPRRPKCGVCPLNLNCKAFEAGDQERYPLSAGVKRSLRSIWS